MPNLQDLIAQKAELERQIEQLQSGARNEAITQIRALMADHGLTVADVLVKPGGGKSKPSETKGKTVAAKYRNDATGETWSGRGLQPNWLKAQIGAGKTLEDFAVAV